MPWNVLRTLQNEWRLRFIPQPAWCLEPTYAFEPVWTNGQITGGGFPPAIPNVIPTYQGVPSNPYTLGTVSYTPPLFAPAPPMSLPIWGFAGCW